VTKSGFSIFIPKQNDRAQNCGDTTLSKKHKPKTVPVAAVVWDAEGCTLGESLPQADATSAAGYGDTLQMLRWALCDRHIGRKKIILQDDSARPTVLLRCGEDSEERLRTGPPPHPLESRSSPLRATICCISESIGYEARLCDRGGSPESRQSLFSYG
jgi:hypothetical protein